MAKTTTKPNRAPARLTAEVGTSGLQHSGGQILAEFDPDLRGLRGIKIYEEMRCSDPTIAVGLRAIGWTLGQVQWRVEAGGETPADEEACCFLESCMADMSHTWSRVIRDALTCMPFGFSWLEGVYKQRAGTEADPPSRYDDGRIGWRKWTLIGHESLSRWEIEDDGGIRGLWQAGWLRGPAGGMDVLVPIEKSVLFRLDDERNNPEGVSLLRAVYLPWWKKKNIEEIEAIGIERDLTGVLIIHMPVGATSIDQQKARDLVEQFKADDMSGFTAPRHGAGEENTWSFEIINSPGSKTIDPGKVVERYQLEIARSFLAQFLMLGQGDTGSRAVGTVQRDMFEMALGAILMNLEETINRFMVPPLFRLNDFGQLTALPQVKAGRVSKTDMDKFATALKNLTDAGHLTPSRDTEQFLRNELQLPELPEEELAAPQGKQKEETGQGDKQAKEFGESDDDVKLPDPDDDAGWEQWEKEFQRIIEKPGRRTASELLRFARSYDYAKKVDEIRSSLEDRLGQLAADLREGRIDHSKWSLESKRAIIGHQGAAYELGVAQATGVAPSKVKLTADQRRQVIAGDEEQSKYWAQFAGEVKAKMTAGEELTTAVDARAKQYAGSVRSAVNKAMIDQEGSRKLRWVRHKSDSCETCLNMDGRVKTAKEWEQGGIWPARQTKCDGNCGCSLASV